jgi:hypothetical protein
VIKSLGLVFAVTLYVTASSPSLAQETKCGAAPALPTSSESAESIKGQLQGQADFLSKLVGKAELSGQVEAARKTIYQSSDRFFAAQKDAYLAYLFCIIVTGDQTLSTTDKLKALNEFKKPPPANQGGNNNGSSHIVVSKFILKPIDPTKPDSEYEIDVYTINRGNVSGRAPITTSSFRSVDGFLTAADVDEEMAKGLTLAIQKPPPSNGDREEIDTGVETWYSLPAGLTQDAWKAIASGEKRFYLFVVLAYTDSTLSVGQFWISEFCASQSKDFSYIRLCPGHNRTYLHK